ncbi:MAG: homoserine kinase type [Kribbellaceae bacterium]|jgi:homoserine kinase type II|nr:homoserine kinase type [Kribbellaceae bacterium]
MVGSGLILAGCCQRFVTCAQLGLVIDRFEQTRATDAESIGNVWYGDRLWAATRFVPGKPHATETAEQIEAAMAEARQFVAQSNLSTLPQSVVHGDFAEWNLHFTDDRLAAIDPLERVLRVNMVMAELWSGPRTGRFDVPMIERQLARTGTAKP